MLRDIKYFLVQESTLPHIGRLFCPQRNWLKCTRHCNKRRWQGPERDSGLSMFVLVANAKLTFDCVVGTFTILSPIVLLRAQQLKPGEKKERKQGRVQGKFRIDIDCIVWTFTTLSPIVLLWEEEEGRRERKKGRVHPQSAQVVRAHHGQGACPPP